MSCNRNVTAAGGNRAASFEFHIRPQFTVDQQACMAGYFDLYSHAEVAQNAEGIYMRLEDKSMPLDESGPWPNEWIALFRRWIDEGCAE